MENAVLMSDSRVFVQSFYYAFGDLLDLNTLQNESGNWEKKVINFVFQVPSIHFALSLY